MNSIKLRFNLNNLYYFSVALWFIAGTITESEYFNYAICGWFISLSQLMAICFLLYRIFTSKYTTSEIVKLILVVSIWGISYYISGYRELIFGLVFLCASKEIDYDRLVKIVFWSVTISTLFVIASSLVGIISNTSLISVNQYTGVENNRFLFGFRHHNFLGQRIMVCLFCYMYRNFNKLSKRFYLTGTILFFFLFFIVRSRTAAILLLIALIFTGILKIVEFVEKRQGKNLVRIIVNIMIMIPMGFSILSCFLYDEENSFWYTLNSLIYKRFSMAHQLYEQYGFSLFGNQINLVSTLFAMENGTKAIVLDNAYAHLLIRCGLLVFLFVVGGYLLVTRQALKNKNYSIAMIIALYFICGITEKWFFLVSYNPFFILISMIIFDVNKKVIQPDEIKVKG